MWKFLKNLFKKNKPEKVEFEYNENVNVVAEKDKDGLWTVEVSANDELLPGDIKEIIKKLQRLIKKGR